MKNYFISVLICGLLILTNPLLAWSSPLARPAFLASASVSNSILRSSSLSAPSVFYSASYSDSTHPLVRFSSAWADPKYASCNTAASVSYLTEKEKQVIYILNLARVNPSLFLRTVVKQYPSYTSDPDLLSSSYYQSFLVFLEKQTPVPLLRPEKVLYESAYCHAVQSGKTGYVGHDRSSAACKRVEKFNGECCFYGVDDPLEIVLDLMIDEGVPSLGHRKALFTRYTKVGVAIAPHSGYGWNAVLDFLFQ